MYCKPLIVFLLPANFSCINTTNKKDYYTYSTYSIPVSKNSNSYLVINKIPLPDGYKRKQYGSQSFSAWLQNRTLKENKIVYLYNGKEKANQLAQYAVLNVSVGNKDLQQCADAVMRLRSEYLFSQKNYSNILFFDNTGKKYQFSGPYTRANFDNYLNRVFGMCGSASLSKQLNKKSFDEVEAGDVIIRGGFPGHAVIVMDVAVNDAGKKIYLLAQSYMPAQDIHVLINPNDNDLSPWYKVEDKNTIVTPEYVFTRDELKTW